MNKIEMFFYLIFRKNPLLKTIVRNIYQSCFDILPNKDNYFINIPIVKDNCFYGFHDQNPFSKDKIVLANKSTIPLRMPTSYDFLDVGYWGGKHFDNWCLIDKTCVWNYHKGCRLQWVKQDRSVIYNTLDDDKRVISKIYDLFLNQYSIIDYPIDSVDSKGCFATSFSYERLQKVMPGYGYNFQDNESYLENNIPDETGLYIIDLNNNIRRLLISLRYLSLCHYEESMQGAFHFVTHSLFSPDGNYVSFLHRWYKGFKRHTRLVIFDIKSGDIHISPTDGMVSHYVWNKKNGIVAYCKINNVDSHVYFSDPSMKSYSRVGYPQINSDGHQSFISDDVFVTDTYPDRRRYAKLYLVNVKTNEVRLISQIKSPKKFQSKTELKHWCCDLHPRSSEDGKYICFDSVHTNTRSLCIMKITD